MKVMFVCTGNICRSAIAEWLLKKKIEQQKIENIEVYSCGIFAIPKDESTYEIKEVMKEYDVDMTKHKATNIRNTKLEEMDIILGMTYSHKYTMEKMYPNLVEKIYTLKEYVEFNKEDKKDIDIQDPWGYDIATHRFCAAIIDQCLDKLIEKIKEEKI